MACIDPGHIHVLTGPYWRLPVRVRWHGDMGCVRPAGMITRLMLEALLARLAEIGTHNGQDWFVTRQRLMEHAFLPDDAEPDQYISWIGPLDRAAAQPDPDGMQEFFEYTALAGHAETPAEAQVRFGAFCQLMLHWLLNRKRPVNLGFAELHPFPVRPNWREFLAYRYRLRRGSILPWTEWVRHFIARGVLHMTDPVKRMALWSITVRHTRRWWKAVALVEKERKRRLNNGRVYFLELARFLAEHRPSLHACFKDYVAQARRPYPQFPPRALNRLTNKKKPPPLARVEKYIRWLGKGARLDHRVRSKIAARALAIQDASLSKMPGVRPVYEDVREERGDVAQPGDGTGGTDGMPVPHVGQEPVASSELLGLGSDERKD